MTSKIIYNVLNILCFRYIVYGRAFMKQIFLDIDKDADKYLALYIKV